MVVLGASDVHFLQMQKCEGGVQLEQYQEVATQLAHILQLGVASVPAGDF